MVVIVAIGILGTFEAIEALRIALDVVKVLTIVEVVKVPGTVVEAVVVSEAVVKIIEVLAVIEADRVPRAMIIEIFKIQGAMAEAIKALSAVEALWRIIVSAGIFIEAACPVVKVRTVKKHWLLKSTAVEVLRPTVEVSRAIIEVLGPIIEAIKRWLLLLKLPVIESPVVVEVLVTIIEGRLLELPVTEALCPVEFPAGMIRRRFLLSVSPIVEIPLVGALEGIMNGLWQAERVAIGPV